MDPLETLSNEHGLIRQFLDNMTMAASKIEQGQRPSEAFFEKAIDFARSFADSFHHFKEEQVLFVRLAEKRKGEIDSQLETLRFQHERGRELINGMGEAMEGYVARDSMKTVDLLEKMAAYAALLRHHIHIEDHIFYPMARKALTADEMEQVGQQFTAQRDKHGADAFERSHKLVVDMGSIITHLS
jgi:hemerythrin-like domain-containing protein